MTLKVHAHEEVQNVEKVNGHFVVTTSEAEYKTRRVLLAIGRRGTPRRLDVPGERSGKVYYRLIDAAEFSGVNIAVVGGGDSAVEAAVSLAQDTSNTVTPYTDESLQTELAKRMLN